MQQMNADWNEGQLFKADEEEEDLEEIHNGYTKNFGELCISI